MVTTNSHLHSFTFCINIHFRMYLCNIYPEDDYIWCFCEPPGCGDVDGGTVNNFSNHLCLL